MKLFTYLEKTPKTDILANAEKLAKCNGIEWNSSIKAVLDAAKSNPQHVCEVEANTADEALLKWLRKYKAGYDRRISQRYSNLPGTVPDPVIDVIIKAVLGHLNENDIAKIKFAHRLSMSAENILGLLLEEYLSKELAEFGWHCCWGETLRSIDFVNEDGQLLQIKNRSNSENSSSSRVRSGTTIRKWFRVNATNGSYLWGGLNTMHNTSKFSEGGFRAFVVETLKSNPTALAVETQNPWKKAD